MDLKALESCIDRYESLKTLENDTPQSRGQKLNQLIADILQAHRIQAVANQRHESKGEIDVSFRAAEMRFILEAKWEQSPIDIAPLGKLKLRLNQRMPNSYGVLLSMSGFTQSVIDQTYGRGLENIFLMGPDIFKALLFGSIEAEKLFGTFIDYASFEGGYNPSLQKVFQYLPKRTNSKVDPGNFFNTSCPALIESLRPEGKIKQYEVILSNLPFGQCGVSTTDSKIYVTLNDGIYILDKNTLKKIITVDSPQNRAVFSDHLDATLFVFEGSVVAVDQNGKFKPLTKRYPGHVRLFRSSNCAHLFSNGEGLGSPFFPVRILNDIESDQKEVICDYPASSCTDAAIIEDGVYVVCGSHGLRFYRNNQEVWQVDSTNCSAINVDRDRILFLENGVRLKSVDFHGKNLQEIASFRLGGSVGDFAVIDKDEYIFHLNYHEDQEQKSCIVRVKTDD